jgi:hypothetical protein
MARFGGGFQLDTLWPVEPNPPRAIAVWPGWVPEWVDVELVKAQVPDPDEPEDRDEPQLMVWPCSVMHWRGNIEAAMAAVPVPKRISLMAVERLIARLPGWTWAVAVWTIPQDDGRPANAMTVGLRWRVGRWSYFRGWLGLGPDFRRNFATYRPSLADCHVSGLVEIPAGARPLGERVPRPARIPRH